MEITEAISSGLPKRPRGVCFISWSTCSCSITKPSVSVMPGATVLTVIPLSPNSFARLLENCSTAAFEPA